MNTHKTQSSVGSTDGSAPAYPMREWINQIRTDFNDGSSFEGNEVQHALVVSFTAQQRGGVKKTEVLEREMVVDWEEYDRQQAALPNVRDEPTLGGAQADNPKH